MTEATLICQLFPQLPPTWLPFPYSLLFLCMFDSFEPNVFDPMHTSILSLVPCHSHHIFLIVINKIVMVLLFLTNKAELNCFHNIIPYNLDLVPLKRSSSWIIWQNNMYGFNVMFFHVNTKHIKNNCTFWHLAQSIHLFFICQPLFCFGCSI